VRALLVLLVVAGLPARPAPEPPEHRSVLLVTIDGLRADAAGAGKGTPGIEAFLRQATHFRAARTPVPQTVPAHVTMMTGLDPLAHGIVGNFCPALGTDRGFALLAEEFRGAGHATAAFLSSALLGRASGIDAGFERFECPEIGAWPCGSGMPPAERVEGPLDWLDGLAPGRPFFLWVHLRLRGAGTDRERYAAEVRRADGAFARLLQAVGGEAVVLLASAHGEGLGEHGEATHGNLCYSSTMDVFLAARAPGLARGAADDALHTLHGVAPSLRCWAGIARDGLAPLAAPGGGIAMGASLRAHRVHGWGQVVVAFDGRWSLIESGPRLELFDRRTDPDELHPVDPRGEPAFGRLERALSAYRAFGRRAGDARRAYEESAAPYIAARRPVSLLVGRTTNARLRDPATGLPFLEEIASARTQIRTGVAARRAEPLRAAIKTLDRLAAADPVSPAPWELLAQAWAGLAEIDGGEVAHARAAGAAEEAIARGFSVAPVLDLLLRGALGSKDADACRRALDVALKELIVPDLRCAERVTELALRIDARGDALSILSRARKALPGELEGVRLSELEARLRDPASPAAGG